MCSFNVIALTFTNCRWRPILRTPWVNSRIDSQIQFSLLFDLRWWSGFWVRNRTLPLGFLHLFVPHDLTLVSTPFALLFYGRAIWPRHFVYIMWLRLLRFAPFPPSVNYYHARREFTLVPGSNVPIYSLVVIYPLNIGGRGEAMPVWLVTM